jgi:hypothetical protein
MRNRRIRSENELFGFLVAMASAREPSTPCNSIVAECVDKLLRAVRKATTGHILLHSFVATLFREGYHLSPAPRNYCPTLVEFAFLFVGRLTFEGEVEGPLDVAHANRLLIVLQDLGCPGLGYFQQVTLNDRVWLVGTPKLRAEMSITLKLAQPAFFAETLPLLQMSPWVARGGASVRGARPIFERRQRCSPLSAD